MKKAFVILPFHKMKKNKIFQMLESMNSIKWEKEWLKDPNESQKSKPKCLSDPINNSYISLYITDI